MMITVWFFPELNNEIPANILPHSAILDGEIVCLDGDGKPRFRDLLFRRGETDSWLSTCSGAMLKICVTYHPTQIRTGAD
jgi:hypothetical protein